MYLWNLFSSERKSGRLSASGLNCCVQPNSLIENRFCDKGCLVKNSWQHVHLSILLNTARKVGEGSQALELSINQCVQGADVGFRGEAESEFRLKCHVC
jgi:hypothetical protein